jgi:Ca2+-binding RTX toxin-like protein
LGGNDTLLGGPGADNLYGGTGNDIYHVDNAGDQLIELAGEGNDVAIATVSFTLSANVERLYLSGSGAIDGKGNALENTLVGNSAANLLEGGAGRDTLIGGKGDDILSGNAGGDVLTGGAGNDAFRFAGAYAAAGEMDVVRDFVHGADHIELEYYYFAAIGSGTFDAANFVAGTHASTTSQHVIYNQTNGILYYDADGSGAGAQIAIARFDGHPVIDAGDFVTI